jgi:hypothetical protein
MFRLCTLYLDLDGLVMWKAQLFLADGLRKQSAMAYVTLA